MSSPLVTWHDVILDLFREVTKVSEPCVMTHRGCPEMGKGVIKCVSHQPGICGRQLCYRSYENCWGGSNVPRQTLVVVSLHVDKLPVMSVISIRGCVIMAS